MFFPNQNTGVEKVTTSALPKYTDIRPSMADKAMLAVPMSRQQVKFSDIPIEVLYNSEINKLKAGEVSAGLRQNPVMFSVDNECFAKDGKIEVTY